MAVGLAVQHPPNTENQRGIAQHHAHNDGGINITQQKLPAQYRQKGHNKDEGEKHHNDQNLIHQIPEEAAGRNEIGEGQHGAGVIVGRQQGFRLVGVANHYIVALPQAAALLHLRGIARLT